MPLHFGVARVLERADLDRGHDGVAVEALGEFFELFLADHLLLGERNAARLKQLAVIVADVAGKIGIETKLIATQPEMAESLASIVRGLISLAMFSEDMDPEVTQFLKATTVAVDGSALKIKLALDPESVVVALDN